MIQTAAMSNRQRAGFAIRKRGLERGWQKRLAKGWQKVGEGLAKGWRRVSGFPCTLQFRKPRGARLDTLVCDSMDNRKGGTAEGGTSREPPPNATQARMGTCPIRIQTSLDTQIALFLESNKEKTLST